MKLRNKKTGEIGYTAVLRSKAIVVMDENAIQLGSYTSLAELNAEWEDCEEPNRYYLIDLNGEVSPEDVKYKHKGLEELGLTFETKEEAERAVEKLKAWKRLKDRGLHVTTFYVEDGSLVIRAKTHNSSGAENWEDLDLLFGGKE